MSNSILTEATRETIKVALSDMGKADTSTKAMFSEAFNLLKTFRTDKASRTVCRTALTKEIESHDVAQSYITRAKKAVTLADKYVDMEVFSKFDVLHYYNIEALVKLFSFIKSHKADVFEELKDETAKVWAKGMESKEYNDKMGEFITTFKAAQGIVDKEGEFSFENYYASIVANLNKLDRDQLAMLMDTITDKFEALEEAELRAAEDVA